MLRVEGVGKIYQPPNGILRFLVRTASSVPVEALQSISFEANAGDIVGLVGPNGAGKSTLIRICASLLTPTSGRVLVDGVDLAEDSRHARAVTGLHLTDERALYSRLTGRENLRFFGVMAGLTPTAADRRAGELLERFGLAHRDGRVFGYSSGMRVRLGLARALLSRPKLVILDEPSRSLDPLASDELHGQLREMAAGGTSVVLSSHRLDEVEAVCDHVLVIINGRQRAWAPIAELSSDSDSAAAALRALLQSGEVS